MLFHCFIIVLPWQAGLYLLRLRAQIQRIQIECASLCSYFVQCKDLSLYVWFGLTFLQNYTTQTVSIPFHKVTDLSTSRYSFKLVLGLYRFGNRPMFLIFSNQDCHHSLTLCLHIRRMLKYFRLLYQYVKLAIQCLPSGASNVTLNMILHTEYQVNVKSSIKRALYFQSLPVKTVYFVQTCSSRKKNW